MLNVPSEFANQPSNAGVTLWPESCGGWSVSCSCANTTVAKSKPQPAVANAKRLIPKLISSARRRLTLGVLCHPCLIILVADVGDVDPSVRHLVHGTVAPSDPL